jgi:hypothetical protein
VSGSVVVVVGHGAAGDKQGSGVAVSATQIVTNYHVVAGATRVSISSPTQSLSGSVQRVDVARDLALVGAPGLSMPAVGTRSSGALRIGERAYAIGAPHGLALTLSEGLVSGLRSYKGGMAVQTTAAISPGSSGGGLFDEAGRLIGITTFGLEGDGLNFALPAEWAVALAVGAAGSAPEDVPAQTTIAAQAAESAQAQDESPMDRARRLGAIRFEQEMQILEAKADRADIAWRRYVAGCSVNVTAVSAGAAAGGRDWFAYGFATVVTREMTEACAEAGTFFSLIQQVKHGMCVAEDAARRAAVYPGTRREIRERYRLDWDGWDRVCT